MLRTIQIAAYIEQLSSVLEALPQNSCGSHYPVQVCCNLPVLTSTGMHVYGESTCTQYTNRASKADAQPANTAASHAMKGPQAGRCQHLERTPAKQPYIEIQ
jgi:hypothetical protein